jgi:hypothetical protein
MVAARMELAVMVSAEELTHLKDIVDDRIEAIRNEMHDMRESGRKADPGYRKLLTKLSNDMRLATTLKARLDVSFH